MVYVDQRMASKSSQSSRCVHTLHHASAQQSPAVGESSYLHQLQRCYVVDAKSQNERLFALLWEYVSIEYVLLGGEHPHVRLDQILDS